MVILIIYLAGVAFTNLLIDTLDGCYMPDEQGQRSIALFIAIIWPLILFVGLVFALLWGLVNAGEKIYRGRTK